MKLFKYIGFFSLICFTFFYTEKIIDVSIMQDSIMVDIKNNADKFYIEPKNAIVDGDYIIPGNVGRNVDIRKSYYEMKRLGYYDESLLSFEEIYPNISIYNNYSKYIIKGNIYIKNVSLIFIINNKSFSGILDVANKRNIYINFFVDSNYLNNNINIIDMIGKHKIYNYGNNGRYSVDNIIINNNIINNKSNNKSLYCLFLSIDNSSLRNCANSKMLSIIPTFSGDYNAVKSKLENGSIILISNVYDLNNIIDYIYGKGYSIVPLEELVKEK